MLNDKLSLGTPRGVEIVQTFKFGKRNTDTSLRAGFDTRISVRGKDEVKHSAAESEEMKILHFFETIKNSMVW